MANNQYFHFVQITSNTNGTNMIWSMIFKLIVINTIKGHRNLKIHHSKPISRTDNQQRQGSNNQVDGSKSCRQPQWSVFTDRGVPSFSPTGGRAGIGEPMPFDRPRPPVASWESTDWLRTLPLIARRNVSNNLLDSDLLLSLLLLPEGIAAPKNSMFLCCRSW